MNIIKRSGEEQTFDSRKIRNAIRKANQTVSKMDELSEAQMDKITEFVTKVCNDRGCSVGVEEIQDIVEKQLMAMGAFDVAKNYVVYRKKRERARNVIKVRTGGQAKDDVTDQSLMLVSSMTDGQVSPWDRAKIAERISAAIDITPEQAADVAKDVESQLIASGLTRVNTALIRELVNNALIDRGFTGQLQDLTMYRIPRDFIMNLMCSKNNENANVVANNPEAVSFDIASLVLKMFAFDAVFSKEVADAHTTGLLHVHDSNFVHRLYCGSHSIEYLKKYGLKGIATLSTTSSSAKSATVLTGHLNTFLASMQAYYAGALGLGYINVFYAPLLMDKTDAQLKQVAQELIFNGSQNAFSRGGQTLFLDFNVHSGVPSYLKPVPAIGAGGKYMFVFPDGKRQEWVPLDESKTEEGNWCLKYGDDVVYEETDGKMHPVHEELGHVLTYGDFENETRRFCSALLNVWHDGDAYGHIFEFPKCDFHVSAETFTDPEQYAIFQQACRLASHNGSTYFIFDRDSVSLASCCFTGDTVVAVSPYSDKALGVVYETLERLYRDNGDAVLWVAGLKSDREACKVVRIPRAGRGMVQAVLNSGVALKMTADHVVPVYATDGISSTDIHAEDLTCSDVLYVPGVNKSEANTKVVDIREMDCDDEYVYCLQMEDESSPYFKLPCGALTHNCRLKVQITDMSLVNHPERLRTCGFANVTVNLPQCAYRARHKAAGDTSKEWELFIAEIDHAMDLAVACHMQKRKFLESVMQPGGPMWQIAKPANDGNPYLKLENCVYIIGMIGANDAVQYLTGKQFHEDDAALNKGVDIISYMYIRTKEYSKEYGLTFKLEESPAESAARRLAKADLMYYRDDALQVYKGGSEEAAYYTNSIHLAADADVNLVERIRKQSMFHSAIESGAIIHAFIGEEQPDPDALAELVKDVFLRTQAAQLTFSPEFTYCLDCGKAQRGLQEHCDGCGSENVIGETRVVGYFSRIQNWNKSKRYGELIARHQGNYSVCSADDAEEVSHA